MPVLMPAIGTAPRLMPGIDTTPVLVPEIGTPGRGVPGIRVPDIGVSPVPAPVPGTTPVNRRTAPDEIGGTTTRLLLRQTPRTRRRPLPRVPPRPDPFGEQHLRPPLEFVRGGGMSMPGPAPASTGGRAVVP